MAEGNVLFKGGKILAGLGVLAGAGIAVGVPWAAFQNAASMGSVPLVIVVLFAVAVGGIVAGVSAFFGIVIPTSVIGSEGSGKSQVKVGPITVDGDGEAQKEKTE